MKSLTCAVFNLALQYGEDIEALDATSLSSGVLLLGEIFEKGLQLFHGCFRNSCAIQD
jgi:hypothetical protein